MCWNRRVVTYWRKKWKGPWHEISRLYLFIVYDQCNFKVFNALVGKKRLLIWLKENWKEIFIVLDKKYEIGRDEFDLSNIDPNMYGVIHIKGNETFL